MVRKTALFLDIPVEAFLVLLKVSVGHNGLHKEIGGPLLFHGAECGYVLKGNLGGHRHPVVDILLQEILPALKVILVCDCLHNSLHFVVGDVSVGVCKVNCQADHGRKVFVR